MEGGRKKGKERKRKKKKEKERKRKERPSKTGTSLLHSTFIFPLFLYKSGKSFVPHMSMSNQQTLIWAIDVDALLNPTKFADLTAE